MRTPLCPRSITLYSDAKAKGCKQGNNPELRVHPFGVNTVLPVSVTVLLVLFSSSAPGAAGSAQEEDPGHGTAEEAALNEVQVELAALRTEAETLRQSASEKISRYEEERERLDEAAENREAAEGRAETADERGQSARLSAARQAANAYKGGDVSLVRAWTGPDGPSGMLERGAYLSLLGDRRSAEVQRADAAEVATDTLADLAGSAEQEQVEATEAASAAREEAEEAVAEHAERTEELLAEQTRLERQLVQNGGTHQQQDQERHREQALTDARSAAAGEADGAAPDGRCDGSVPARHANGEIPDSLLCPLPQPGEQLRADAAEAFIELDGAFREEFDRPMCVADSYRPYHEQLRLFQEKLPGMAAEPGTSQHGLGLAVDLCGGVDEPESAEHEWMLQSAPEYGWDNPDWARGGFEPWHWEFAP